MPETCIGSTTSSLMVTTSGTASGFTSAIELSSGSAAGAYWLYAGSDTAVVDEEVGWDDD